MATSRLPLQFEHLGHKWGWFLFAGERYTLTAKQVEGSAVDLNRNTLRLTSSGDLPQLEGEPVKAGGVSFAPISITYLSLPGAGNPHCQQVSREVLQ